MNNSARSAEATELEQHAVLIPAGPTKLAGDLQIPHAAHGIVLFAHGSGSGRHSSRNRQVAADLNAVGLGTLLIDLLTEQEEIADQLSGHLRFDIGLLANRLISATTWLREFPQTEKLPIGYFGASTGGGAALVAAASLASHEQPASPVRAVVSRGGRPDLAGDALPMVETPTLLIVGGDDFPVIEMNQTALEKLGASEKKLEIIPGATHLFPEPGALTEVARLAGDWFNRFLTRE